jgi:hypothetical protein
MLDSIKKYISPETMLKIKKIFLIILFLFGIIPFLSAQNFSEIKLYENEILQSFHSGEDYKLFKSIESLLYKFPENPIASLYYQDIVRFIETEGPVKIETVLKKLLSNLNAKKNSQSDIHRLLLNIELEKLYSSWDNTKHLNFSRSIPWVRKWEIIGPFNKYGAADRDYPFLPEIISDFKSASHGETVITAGDDGVVNFLQYMFPESGAAYARVSFKTGKTVKLRFFSSGKYKVFINGSEVLKNDESVSRNVRILKISDTGNISVMVKLMSFPSWQFRMLVTDDSDRPVEVEPDLEKTYQSNFKHSEVIEYPYSEIISSDDADKNRYLGYLFENLNSRECVDYYKKDFKTSGSIYSKILYALAMIEHGSSDIGSAYYTEGVAIVSEMAQSFPVFAPAQYRRLINLKNSSSSSAYETGKELIKQFPYHIYINYQNLILLRESGLEHEFIKAAADFKKKFPDSVLSLSEEAEYFRHRDTKKFIKLNEEILKFRKSGKTVKNLTMLFAASGEYYRAVETIYKYGFEKTMRDDLIDILILNKDYIPARSIIMNDMIKYGFSSAYYRLGLIGFLKGDDPSLFWQRMLILNPSMFNMKDFMEYLSEKKLESPLKNPIVSGGKKDLTGPNDLNENKTVYDFEKAEKECGSYPSLILKRLRFFYLNSDGSSRALCEDIVYLKKHSAVAKWGEYRLPYSGKFKPIQVKVISKDGNVSEAFTVQKTDGAVYLNIADISEKSILHLSYIIEEPIKSPRGSLMFSLPFTSIQNYDEPVSEFIFRVSAPDNVNVKFYYKDKWEVKKISADSNTVYSIEEKNLFAPHRENFSGSAFNILPFIAFTTMDGPADFTQWYMGLVYGKDKISGCNVDQALKGNSTEDTVKKIYEYTARGIELSLGWIYYPDAPDNTIYLRSGTSENRVLLAKALLETFGIKSYIAFARNRLLPPVSEYYSPEIFSDIILYVPVDINKSIWLDFGSTGLPCGYVRGSLNGTDALIIIGKNSVWKKISPDQSGKKNVSYAVKLNEKGNALFKVEFLYSGVYGESRRLFNDKRNLDEKIHVFVNNIFPNSAVEKFDLLNIDNYNKPFSISVVGDSGGLALTTTGGLIFQPILNKSAVYSLVTLPERIYPLHITDAINEVEIYNYSLPDIYKKTAINSRFELNKKYGSATFVFKKNAGSTELQIDKAVKIKSGIITTADYPDFLNFCLELKKIEYQNIKLQKEN